MYVDGYGIPSTHPDAPAPPRPPARLTHPRRPSKPPEKGLLLDLLISFRVYDPDGDQEDTLPEGREELAAGEAGFRGGARGDGGGAAGLSDGSPAARREELEAMAAAAAPGGLAARPRRSVDGGGGGIAPLGHPLLAAGGGGGRAAAGEGGASVGFPGQPEARGGGGVADNTVGGGHGGPAGVGAVAAPAADGWGLQGGAREPSGSAGRNGDAGVDGSPTEGVGGDGGRGRGRGRRYFGLLSRDEWISASSSRVEKLNSRAPWKNSWTAEAPVNDRDDPYMTEDGNHLVFAVPRAPVDGAPCLVSEGSGV